MDSRKSMLWAEEEYVWRPKGWKDGGMYEGRECMGTAGLPLGSEICVLPSIPVCFSHCSIIFCFLVGLFYRIEV